MAQKNATPTEEQQQTIIRAGLNPAHWTVIRDRMYSMVIINRDTKEVKNISK